MQETVNAGIQLRMNLFFKQPMKNRKTLKIKFILAIGSVVTLFVAVVFYWMLQQTTQGIMAQLDEQSKALLQQIIITRTWIADHGGLFVEKRPGVEASPFLSDSDIKDTAGKTYHFRNPAMATREISDYAATKGLYKFHLTSLKLVNQANSPSPFERDALLFFQKQGYDKVKSGLTGEGDENGFRVYRRIVPLQVEESCLECHSNQDYVVGDIRGALTVTIPMSLAIESVERHRYNLIAAWFGIVCLVSALIYFFLNRLVLRPVSHLHHVAQSLIAGEYSIKADLSTGDEFESLAQAFNDMTDRLKKGYEGTIKSLVAAIDARDPYTKGHTARVAHYATAIAREMGFGDEFVEGIALGATLHDIGKIGIPDDILCKSLPLSEEESTLMKNHTEKGAAIIKDADFLLCALPAILYHHERHDGQGYPQGLQGDTLPMMAKIISVADTFDAMTTDRPYRKALSAKNALEEIEKNSGRQFDPEVVQAFRVVCDKKLIGTGCDPFHLEKDE